MKKVIYIICLLMAYQTYAQKDLIIGGGGTFQTVYRDADNDGYGNPNISMLVTSQTPGWVRNNTDCNDADPNVTLGYVWYQDLDGDGFGDPNNSIVSCLQFAGYVSNNTDACPTVAGTNNGCPSVNLTSHYFGNYNYIYEEVLQVAATESTYNSVADNQKIRSVSFYDGLGRKVQSRAIGHSPLGKDIVTHFEYDNLGRMAKEYLPYVSTQNNGYYETGGEAKTLAHYNTAKYDHTTNPYAEKRFEKSPLNRVLETGAPGASWLINPTSDADHTVKMGYAVNSATDNLHKVRYYQVNASNSLTNPSPTYYPVGSLYKTVVKNENWTSGKLHTTEEFTNKFGQTVLKRTYAMVGNTVTPHDTYFVYDVYNNLSFVIPPKVTTADGISTTELNELCYQYKYDKYNRLVEKKLAGKGWEYIVYDQMDRPILTQDAVQRAKTTKEWLFTKYDAYGRVAYTGVYKDNRTRTQVQASADAHVNKYEFQNGLIIAFYDYTNFAYPTNITANDVYTVNYYDNYNFDTAGLSIPTTVYGVATTNNARSLPTGVKERVLTNTGMYWITKITGYDDKARAIYVATKNSYLNVTDIVQNKLDFTGKVLETDAHHTANTTLSIVDKFSYDHVGRMLTQKQTINTQEEELIVKNNYDELGQLESKEVGNTESKPLQIVDYTYNVRGWLTGINDVDNIGTDLFTFKVNYNSKDISGTTGYNNLYDGNIAETVWRTASDHVKRGYQYKYDGLNRILESDYRENNSLSSTGLKFDTEYEYDKNGNLKTLVRYDINGYDIDELDYSYATDSNKLNGIVDQTDNTEGFEFFSTNYSYESNNGNLIADSGKGITAIDYNHLNLPTKVHFGSTKSIEYIYTAGGTKVEKKVTNGAITSTQYAGSFIYENSVLKHFSNSQGYVERNGNDFVYIYQYADHLGNIRLNYTNIGSRTAPNLQIREENNYYPFGFKHKGYNNTVVGVQNDYKYNGKELQDEVINGKALQWYDYGARNYDPSIGRFFNIDPLADAPTQVDKSPLAYVWNNPIRMTDPSGMHPEMEEEDWNNVDEFDAAGNWIAGDSFDNPYGTGVDVSTNGISISPFSNVVDQQQRQLQLSKKRRRNKVKYSLHFGEGTFDSSPDDCCGGSFDTALIFAGGGDIVDHMTQTKVKPMGSNQLHRCLLCDGTSRFDYVGASVMFARVGKTSSLLALNLAQLGDVTSLATASQLRWFGRGAAAFTVGVNYYRWRSGEISGSKFTQETTWTGIGVFGGAPGLIVSSLYWFAGDVLGGKEMAQRRFEFRQRQRVEDPKAFWHWVHTAKCFVRGTKILMSDLTEKSIENIKIGDKILGVNMVNFKFEEDKVINVTKFKSKKIIKMVLSNSNTIEFTNDHPFWVVGKGWSVFNVQAAKTKLEFEVNQMEEKDYILIYDNGKLRPLQIIELYDTKEFKDVYNLDNVEINNTFFANKVLVHNRAN